MTQGGMHGRLGRGINFGNALDSARDEVPGLRLKARYLDEVRDAGFDTVRLPVRWSAHAEMTTPYTIDPRFFERVDQAIEHALRRDLTVGLNVHHYHEPQAAPHEHQTRFVTLWQQIAARS